MKVDKKNITLFWKYKMFYAAIIIIASGFLIFPKNQKKGEIDSNTLLSKAVSSERYISTDEISHKIISKDPSFILVDVRDQDSYIDYSLPGAISIPLVNLLDEDYASYINQDQYNIIFYSDDNFYADQAWLICSRLGYKNLRVLEGGINKWFKTIINPMVPDESMAEAYFKLYNTRKASSMYYGVAYPDKSRENEKTLEVPKKVITVKKKKKRVAEGGC